MEINHLIDKDLAAISILEEMVELCEWLKTSPYLVVVDEDSNRVGIVTFKDVVFCPNHQVIDCDFYKPALDVSASIEEAFDLMKATGNDCLPVTENNKLVGVIGLAMLVEGLLGRSTLSQKSIGLE